MQSNGNCGQIIWQADLSETFLLATNLENQVQTQRIRKPRPQSRGGDSQRYLAEAIRNYATDY